MKVIEWKPIKGFDGYFINELGEVKRKLSELIKAVNELKKGK